MIAKTMKVTVLLRMLGRNVSYEVLVLVAGATSAHQKYCISLIAWTLLEGMQSGNCFILPSAEMGDSINRGRKATSL